MGQAPPPGMHPTCGLLPTPAWPRSGLGDSMLLRKGSSVLRRRLGQVLQGGGWGAGTEGRTVSVGHPGRLAWRPCQPRGPAHGSPQIFLSHGSWTCPFLSPHDQSPNLAQALSPPSLGGPSAPQMQPVTLPELKPTVPCSESSRDPSTCRPRPQWCSLEPPPNPLVSGCSCAARLLPLGFAQAVPSGTSRPASPGLLLPRPSGMGHNELGSGETGPRSAPGGCHQATSP